MTRIAELVSEVRGSIAAACQDCGRDPDSVQLLPVSKRHSVSTIREAMDAGLRTFGENRVQELVEKATEIAASDVNWHIIGSVQTNKLNQLLQVPGLALLQSLDRVKLADALQFALDRDSRRLRVLMQVDATGEASKHGVTVEDAPSLMRHLTGSCPNLDVVGLMAMGPLHSDATAAFGRVARLRVELSQSSGLGLEVLSMGMTGDLSQAIAAGSTMVRVGTAVFGPRPGA